MENSKLGRYELLSELGRGAMGVVYRASDPLLNRVVAVKTVNLTGEQDEGAAYEARFYQEAKAAGGLNHPNIVTIYDIGRSGNIIFMAMECLEGRELRDMIAGGQRVPLDQALTIAAQVADGLAYAHERGVVHRDVKPANIIVIPDNVPKITDFGIARMRSSEVKTQTGMLLGSPKYMSPEQVQGKRADPRSDIFSLGIIVYEMLTGAAPFTGDSVNAIMFQIVNFLPPRPSAANSDIPEMLDYIVAKALAKNIDERYASATEFAADLRACQQQLRSGASPLAPSRPGLAPGTAGAVGVVDPVVALPGDVIVAGPSADSARTNTGPARPLSLSPAFDSFEATQKLASQTGMKREFDEYSTTLKMPAPTPEALRAAVPKALNLPNPKNIRDHRDALGGTGRASGSGKRDGMVIVAAALAALAVAAAILLV
jgi:serine/threonine protein kinase